MQKQLHAPLPTPRQDKWKNLYGFEKPHVDDTFAKSKECVDVKISILQAKAHCGEAHLEKFLHLVKVIIVNFKDYNDNIYICTPKVPISHSYTLTRLVSYFSDLIFG